MRNISGASLAAISQSSGLEPVIIVRAFWGGNPTSYCDRKFETSGLVGRLLEISGIEDIIDISHAASSVNLSVTLDDAQGDIKAIFDNTDVHLVYVQVLQWFSNIPVSDAFVIFEGQISSPIIWSEGTRTLKFDVVTKVNDVEVGFSAEEADFPFLPNNLIGKAWPIVFGSVPGNVPLDLNASPTAVFASGFAIVDHEVWEAELAQVDVAINKAMEQSEIAWILGLNNAYKAARYKPFNGGYFEEDPSQADQYDTAASNYFAQSANYKAEAQRLLLEKADKQALFNLQKSLEFRIIPVAQTNLPPGLPFVAEFGNYTANAVAIAGQIVITNIQEKVDVNARIGTNNYQFAKREVTDQYEKTSQKQKFVWIDGGTEIKVHNYPRIFIVSIGVVNVVNVWARTKYGLAVVPRNYYAVDFQDMGGGLVITRLIFPTPLESLPGFWEAGSVSCDCIGTVGPNVVDIMRWVIDRWGQFPVDETSWNSVRARVDNMPANFALTQRKNVVTFLQEVAFQARCAIWINDRTYFIRFLPDELAPVETITDSDVEVNSLTVSCTETERLVTKFIAKWKQRPDQSEENLIIFRYNILKYGTHEESYDFYIYNNAECVAKAAEFWMIRKSNTFKYITCKVTLNKLRIEAFDPITVNFAEGIVANGPVTGIVQKAAFQPDEDTIALEVWLPVRFGEMVQYTFAYPGTTSSVYPVLSDPFIRTGNPWEGALNAMMPVHLVPQVHGITYSHFDPFTHGTFTPGNEDPNPPGLVTILDQRAIAFGRPAGLNDYNNSTNYQIKPIVPFDFINAPPATFYGEVLSEATDDGLTYNVNVYMQGRDKEPKQQKVRIGKLPDGAKIKEGYPLMVSRTIITTKNPPAQDTITIEFIAQPPSWLPPSDT